MPTLYYVEQGRLQTYELPSGSTIIGRRAECDVVLKDRSVSGRHARISCVHDRFMVEDLGSSHGTQINKKTIPESRRRFIVKGDALRLGKMVLWFDAEPEDEDQKYDPFEDVTASRSELGPVVEACENELVRQLMALPDMPQAGKERIETAVKNMIGVLAEHARLRLREQVVLTQIVHILGRFHDVRELLGAALKLVVTEFKAQRGYILLWDQDLQRLKAMVTHQFDLTGPQAQTHDVAYSQTIVNRSYDKAQIILIEDALATETFQSAQSIVASSIRSVAAVPLVTEKGQVWGVIYLDHLKKTGLFRQDQTEFLTAFAGQILVAFQNARRYAQLFNDPSCNLYSRAYIGKRLEAEVKRTVYFGRPICMVMAYIDQDQLLANQYGQEVLERIARELANQIGANLRPSDLAGRWGTSEFLLLLPETGQGAAVKVAEQIRAGFMGKNFGDQETPLLATTTLVVAEYKKAYDGDADAILAAIGHARRRGGNRVVPA